MLPVCALFASCLQDLVQLLHHHRDVDLCAFGKHLGLFLEDEMCRMTTQIRCKSLVYRLFISSTTASFYQN